MTLSPLHHTDDCLSQQKQGQLYTRAYFKIVTQNKTKNKTVIYFLCMECMAALWGGYSTEANQEKMLIAVNLLKDT